jgi:hypothetical protein
MNKGKYKTIKPIYFENGKFDLKNISFGDSMALLENLGSEILEELQNCFKKM